DRALHEEPPMRRVVGSVVLALTTSVAVADDAKAPEPKPAEPTPAPRPSVPLRVVRVMPESQQALLFDRNRGTHVLAEVGGTAEGYRVDAIGDDDVPLSRAGGQVVLAAPDQGWRRRNRDHRVAERDVFPADPYPSKPVVQPADPYASAQPIDPYAD